MSEKIDPSGTITSLMGNGSGGCLGDGGPATAALFQVQNLNCDGAGNLYIADPTCQTVRKVSICGLSAIAGTTTICTGNTSTLSNTITGGTWSSTDPAVATISSTGVVSGIAAGTATIIYTLGGFFVTTDITVGALASVTGPSFTCIGATITLTDTTSGGTWTSGSTTIATIGSSSGIVTGVSNGTTTISYIVSAGCMATKVVTVGGVPAITGSMSVCAGTTSALSNTASGGTWSSSNTGVATIGSATGVITGVSAGTSIITYSLGGACIATTTVTVTSIAAITGGTLDSVGYTVTLSDATSGGTWTSSNTAIGYCGQLHW